MVELTAWGAFVKAWGWGVEDGSPELQVCTAAIGCQEGIEGSEQGQINAVIGVAADGVGDVYLVDWTNHRVQKFSPAGEFLLMFGKDVNKTKVEEAAPQAQRNICAAASGDVCQKGSTGTGDGEFSEWAIGSFIAADPPGAGTAIYVGDKDRVQKFNPDGTFLEAIPVAGTVQSLAIDSSKNLYVAFDGKADVFKLNSAGAEQCKATLTSPQAVASAPDGSFYAIGGAPRAVHHFGPACEEIDEPFGSDELSAHTTSGLATGAYCYASGYGIYFSRGDFGGANSFVRAYGATPDLHASPGEGCEPPKEAPTISSQKVTAAESGSSTVQAEINPNYWEDTTYYVEFGTEPCAEGGCNQKLPVTPASLVDEVVKKGILTAGVTLPTPLPDTTYYYRFVSDSSGGGPVYGVDPDGDLGPAEASFEEGEERSFRTFKPLACFDEPPCLPEGRRYEQVSPIEKSGYDVQNGLVIAGADADKVIYGSFGAFEDARQGSFPDTYLSSRSSDWQTEPLDPRYDTVSYLVNMPVVGVSGDFSKQLVATNAKLTPEAVGDDNTAINFYIHDSPTDTYQYVGTAFETRIEPPLSAFLQRTHFAGASESGEKFVFTINGSLDSNPAPPEGEKQRLYVFDTTTGELSYLGILPDEGLDPAGSFPAGAIDPILGKAMVTFRSISADGGRVYWTHDASDTPLYLREGGVTILVSERASDESAQSATMWGASSDGRYAFLTSSAGLTEDASPTGTDLYRYDATADELADLTGDSGGAGVSKVMGVSEDGAYAYFIATGNLAPRANGDNPKIYAWHEGEIRLVGELATEADQLADFNPVDERWRISPDGRYLGFLFGGRVEGAHPHQRQPHSQAYLYDFGADILDCASCPPQGLSTAAVSLHPKRLIFSSLLSYAAGLTRNVTNNGQFFFESDDRLLLEDTNGRKDVYMYRDGAVHLISTGKSDTDSYFGDATPSGDNAFFLTREGLVAQDKGHLIDLYDARVGGGIASQDKEPEVPCDVDADCRGQATSPPAGSGPGSGAIGPSGNAPPPPRCKKGFVRRGGKCMKKKHHHKKKHRASRRVGR